MQQAPSGRDITSAHKYGRIINLFGSEETPSDRPLEAQRYLLRKLDDFHPDHDYLCYAGGDPVLPMLVGMVLAELGFTHVRFLKWNRIRDAMGQRFSGAYQPITIPIIEELEVA